mmetsp:Transcript_114035/g.362602  ORF Transcript_114035/g.362602 Transcript_114035/m.362602 type:complete len:85 (+) Transcript_114035:2325-2579(+)
MLAILERHRHSSTSPPLSQTYLCREERDNSSFSDTEQQAFELSRLPCVDWQARRPWRSDPCMLACPPFSLESMPADNAQMCRNA